MNHPILQIQAGGENGRLPSGFSDLLGPDRFGKSAKICYDVLATKGRDPMSSENQFGVHYFPPTNWSLVNRAGHGVESAQRQALNELVRRYVPALQSHLVLQKGIEPGRAEDLIQEFLLEKVVEQAIVARADRVRGRFRSFLLVSLDRFVISKFRVENAAKRHASGEMSLDEVRDIAANAATAAAAQNAFDVAWARQLLSDTLDRMHRQCLLEERPDIWGVFEGRLLQPLLHQVPPISYDELVNRFSLASPAQASNVLVTGRRMFERMLRQAIGEYEVGDHRIDAEIADLQKVLAGHPALCHGSAS
jgi:hypothetical protein